MIEAQDEQNGQEPWYSSEGYFAHTMNQRVALEIGQARLATISAELRLEMANGKAATLQAQVRSVQDLVAQAQADVEALKAAATEAGVSEARIAVMVDRFLGWRLPTDFNPDGGISFKRTFNEQTKHPGVHEPTGTNLFDARQAREMVLHLLAAEPPQAGMGDDVATAPAVHKRNRGTPP